ncbi:hypothetical protein KSP39_PZI022610 [Platanthera zijinensis]|uniref:Hydroxyproline-rich glycoprotein family protein n=1 Tax=Platanthera zijinensis TaxID=2320716 RepID=A0AAP0FUK8_9ASPA
MKTSLRKLRGLSLHKGTDLKEKMGHGVPTLQNELLQASQDVLDMRSCYDSLLSSAAATANSAYEFSEALREMGTCLLEKTSLNEDEESGRTLLLLGKAQFELQRLVDSYRVHVIQTITTPSESLLKELHAVEDMKRQCDDKRDLYKFMSVAHREKGKIKHAKGESFSSLQLQAAQEDYEEEANLFFFRLKSLKQGQSRSLLTQAARHHAAQLNFFRKGVKSLETIEPHVKVVAEQKHIDYNLVGLEDDVPEDDEDNEDNEYYDGNDDAELSFDYRQNENIQDIGSANRASVQEVLEKIHDDLPTFGGGTRTGSQSAPILPDSKYDSILPSFGGGTRTGSQSAPILPDDKYDPSERIKKMHDLSPRRFHTYVLPTPVDVKSALTGSHNSLSEIRRGNKVEQPKELRHSSPLEPSKPAKNLKDELSSSHIRLPISNSVLKESNLNSGPIRLPPPLAEGLSWPLSNSRNGVSYSKSIKRHAFSGPLIGKSWSNNPKILTNESILPAEYRPPGHSSGLGRVPSLTQVHPSPRASPSCSPLPMLSPKINELHELPRPPRTSADLAMPSGLAVHSGPLITRSQGLYATNGMLSNTASPLPTPPPFMGRSFSIPSNGQRSGNLAVANFIKVIRNPDPREGLSSPPLTIISPSNPRHR